jgi:hypothetical protein
MVLTVTMENEAQSQKYLQGFYNCESTIENLKPMTKIFIFPHVFL